MEAPNLLNARYCSLNSTHKRLALPISELLRNICRLAINFIFFPNHRKTHFRLPGMTFTCPISLLGFHISSACHFLDARGYSLTKFPEYRNIESGFFLFPNGRKAAVARISATKSGGWEGTVW